MWFGNVQGKLILEGAEYLHLLWISVGFCWMLNFYKMLVVLFLEDSEGDISRDMISAELNDGWKGWGSRVGSQTFYHH